MTLNKMSWQYGRLEVRAKLPQVEGMWPAIWTLGVNMPSIGYPRCGEIDIMEYYGRIPGQIWSNVHYDADGIRMSKQGTIQLANTNQDFHIYSAEWSEDSIDFFCDGILYNSFPVAVAGQGSDNPFRNPHYILLNLALGASGGKVNDTNLPQKLLIDYVRVYKLGNGT